MPQVAWELMLHRGPHLYPPAEAELLGSAAQSGKQRQSFKASPERPSFTHTLSLSITKPARLLYEVLTTSIVGPDRGVAHSRNYVYLFFWLFFLVVVFFGVFLVG